MLSSKKAIKTLERCLNNEENEKYKGYLTQLMSDYVFLYEKREIQLVQMEHNRTLKKNNPEYRKKFNEYHRNYYHNVVKKKKT